MIVNEGTSRYSICARSGAPFAAVSAVRSLVYSGSPCPALTTLTLIAGYAFSKTATSWLIFGTQVQKVRVVGVFMALSMSAWVTAAAAVPPEEPDPELEQASSARPAATADVAAKKVRRVSYLGTVSSTPF